MQTYCIGITRIHSKFERLLALAGIAKMRTEEHKVIQTAKTEAEIIKYYNEIGMDILFIRTYEIPKGQKAESIG